jgi:hypothetical protein
LAKVGSARAAGRIDRLSRSVGELAALWRALALPLRPSLTYVVRQIAL